MYVFIPNDILLCRRSGGIRSSRCDVPVPWTGVVAVGQNEVEVF